MRNVQSWFQSVLKTILTVVLRKNPPVMGSASTAGPLTLGMEERKVVSDVERRSVRETVDAVSANMPLARRQLL